MSKKLNLQPMGTRVLIQPLEQEAKQPPGCSCLKPQRKNHRPV
jgi:hypothetical protein